jgi:superfamily II DNA or RNA helicase
MTQDNEALLQQFATIHNITWRHGQENAITQILDAHSQNKKCVILDAPTGAGKSLIAMATAWCLLY